MSNYTYMVTNKINGKVYVGSHSWDKEGIDPNYYGSGTAITRAVKKYGKENFQVEVLYYYDTIEECRQDEERILTEYNVRDCPHSYNCKNRAMGGDKGKPLSESTKRKISESRTGERHPLYGKRGKDSPRYGKHHTEETRKKLSRAMTGEKHPQYGKRGKDSHNYGRHRTDATRKKLSQAQNYKKIPVVAIQKATGRVRMFLSQAECCRVLTLRKECVSACLLGRQKSTGGYTFKKINRDKRVFTVSERSKADINRLRGIA